MVFELREGLERAKQGGIRLIVSIKIMRKEQLFCLLWQNFFDTNGGCKSRGDSSQASSFIFFRNYGGRGSCNFNPLYTSRTLNVAEYYYIIVWISISNLKFIKLKWMESKIGREEFYNEMKITRRKIYYIKFRLLQRFNRIPFFHEFIIPYPLIPRNFRNFRKYLASILWNFLGALIPLLLSFVRALNHRGSS